MEEKPSFEIIHIEDDNPRAKTFILHKEDHTLGNALCRIITKMPDVEFCGYTIPHPSEHKINIRIQTYKKPAIEILQSGLRELSEVCKHVLTTFEDSMKEYEKEKGGLTIE
ncbi:unnamed protein product [Gordionus sp. m RMFG-2023]|uniref:DNA-directed RNA polymerases I and III subunit RPAC2-like isoform X2 n=1 Tax=Gordionus sp. m RMFG-2023 TaxID=3053472 RepID=UPI0030E158A4